MKLRYFLIPVVFCAAYPGAAWSQQALIIETIEPTLLQALGIESFSSRAVTVARRGTLSDLQIFKEGNGVDAFRYAAPFANSLIRPEAKIGEGCNLLSASGCALNRDEDVVRKALGHSNVMEQIDRITRNSTSGRAVAAQVISTPVVDPKALEAEQNTAFVASSISHGGGEIENCKPASGSFTCSFATVDDVGQP